LDGRVGKGLMQRGQQRRWLWQGGQGQQCEGGCKIKEEGDWRGLDSCMQIETWFRSPVSTYRINKYIDIIGIMMKQRE
jgi:hypothetical protein